MIEKGNSKTLNRLQEYLEKGADVRRTKSQQEYQNCLTSGECNVGLQLIKEFDMNIEEDNIDTYIKINSVKQDNYSIPVLFDLDTLFSALLYNADSSNSNDEFNKRFEDYIRTFTLNYSEIKEDSRRDLTGLLLSSINFIAILIIIISMNIFAKHKNHKIFNRILISGVSNIQYIANIIICLNIILSTFLILITLYVKFILNLDHGYFHMSLKYYMVEMLFFNSILLIFLNIFIRTQKTNSFLGLIPIILVPISMLGGYFWPFQIMPEYLKKIGYLLPTSWSNLYLQNQMGVISMLFMIIFMGIMLLLMAVKLIKEMR